MSRKAWKIILCASLSIPLLGCSKAEKVELKAPYTCEVEIKTESDEYLGSLERDEARWTFSYTEPEEINGLVITYEGENYNVKLGDIEFTDDRDSLPDSAISTMIISALDSATLSADVKFSTSNDTVIAKGSAGEMDYEITFKDDIPKHMEIGGIEVSFKNFKLK